VRIAQELRLRGIPDEQVRTALAAVEDDWNTAARTVLNRQFRAPATDIKTRARQMRFLEYRGFTAAQIRTAIKGGADDSD